MEEIDLKELFNFVKNKIGLLIVITVGISLVGVIYGLFLYENPNKEKRYFYG